MQAIDCDLELPTTFGSTRGVMKLNRYGNIMPCKPYPWKLSSLHVFSSDDDNRIVLTPIEQGLDKHSGYINASYIDVSFQGTYYYISCTHATIFRATKKDVSL